MRNYLENQNKINKQNVKQMEVFMVTIIITEFLHRGGVRSYSLILNGVSSGGVDGWVLTECRYYSPL